MMMMMMMLMIMTMMMRRKVSKFELYLYLASCCEAKRIVRIAEEVFAGRNDVLGSLPNSDLQLVLDAVSQKRKADTQYLGLASKRQKLRALPQIPDIENARIHVLDPNVSSDMAFANSCLAKGLQISSVKAS